MDQRRIQGDVRPTPTSKEKKREKGKRERNDGKEKEKREREIERERERESSNRNQNIFLSNIGVSQDFYRTKPITPHFQLSGRSLKRKLTQIRLYRITCSTIANILLINVSDNRRNNREWTIQ